MAAQWQKYVNSGKSLPATFPDLTSQFDVGYQYGWDGCTAWATIADFIRVRVAEGYPAEKYSRLAEFWMSRKQYGQQIGDPNYINKNQGVFEDNALETLIDFGPMLEQYDPSLAAVDPTKYNWVQEYQLAPPDKWMANEKLQWSQVYQIDCSNPDQKLADTLDALARGNAILASIFVWNDIFSVGPNGVIPDHPTGSTSNMAHEVNLTSANPATERIKFPNSWGPTWGDNGNGYISYDYLKNFAYELFVIVPLKQQSVPVPVPQPAPTPQPNYPSDILGTQWQSVAEWVLDNKVMYEYGSGMFQPDQPITRGQFASSLMNLYNLSKK